jgi:hypothetical protein
MEVAVKARLSPIALWIAGTLALVAPFPVEAANDALQVIPGKPKLVREPQLIQTPTGKALTNKPPVVKVERRSPFLKGLKGGVAVRPVPKHNLNKNPNFRTQQKAPIIHKPFEMVRPTGVPGRTEPIPPNEIITFPDGKKLRAQEWFDSANQLEKEFNLIGGTFRSAESVFKPYWLEPNPAKKILRAPPKDPRMAGAKMLTAAEMSQQIKQVPKLPNGYPLLPVTAMTPANSAKINELKVQVAATPPANRPGGKPQKFVLETIGPRQSLKDSQTQKLPFDISKLNPGPKFFSLEPPWVPELTIGDYNDMAARVGVNFGAFATIHKPVPGLSLAESWSRSDSSFDFLFGASGDVWLFGNKVTLLGAEVSATAPANPSKPLKANGKVTLVGYDIGLWSPTSSGETLDCSERVFELPVEYSMAYSATFFRILNLDGYIGVTGLAGLDAELHLYRSGAGIVFTPFFDVDAYLTLDLNILNICGVQFGPILGVVDGQMPMSASWNYVTDGTHTFLSSTPNITANFLFLKGELWIGAYCWLPCASLPPICKKEVRHTIASYPGIEAKVPIWAPEPQNTPVW